MATLGTESERRILEACSRCIRQFGYKKLTVDDVARHAGLSRRSVYIHFADKERLVRAVIENAHHSALDAMRHVLASPSSAIEQLSDLLVARIKTNLSNRLDLDPEELPSSFAALEAEMRDREREIVAGALTLCSEERSLPSMPVDSMAGLLLRATDAFSYRALSDDERADTPGVERKLRRLVLLLIRGMEFANPTEIG